MSVSDAELAVLARRVAEVMRAGSELLVTAESCTGGWVGKVCTDLPGSSAWFRGGAIVYDNDLKVRMTGVNPATLDKHGAVSEATVSEMARGALASLDGTVSVAISGIAGPDGGTPDKPVGTVWFAWGRRRGKRTMVVTRHRLLPGDRDSVRRQSVEIALTGVLEILAPRDMTRAR
jgi:nicotinamide-nucleotide amidase